MDACQCCVTDSCNSPNIIRNLVQDEDTDVRIRACRLIESLWLLYTHEKQQNKRTHEHNHLFPHIKAGELLAEAVSIYKSNTSLC